MAGIVVNTSNTVGSAGFYGPFAKNIAAKVVPGPTPPNYWTPGTIPNFGVSVVKTTPSAAGTMAMVFVNFLTPDGQEIASGSCLVNIVP
jgi:ABC-type glycerol-3-phosphate transport system substrate-binding protein